MLMINRSTSVLVLVFLFLKEVFFCVYSFVVQIFFIFQDILWQLSNLDVFFVVPFINSTG